MASSKSQEPNHVIVIGGGLAGLSATLEAVSHGASVTIIEKEKSLGGNSAKATSGKKTKRIQPFYCVNGFFYYNIL